jgi:hypothetical protein
MNSSKSLHISGAHVACEQVTEDEEAQTQHEDKSGSHRCDGAQGDFVASYRNHNQRY